MSESWVNVQYNIFYNVYCRSGGLTLHSHSSTGHTTVWWTSRWGLPGVTMETGTHSMVAAAHWRMPSSRGMAEMRTLTTTKTGHTAGPQVCHAINYIYNSGLIDLCPKWVRLGPNGTNSGTFSDQISVYFWTRWVKMDWSEKVPEFGANLTHFGHKSSWFLERLKEQKNLIGMFSTCRKKIWSIEQFLSELRPFKICI